MAASNSNRVIVVEGETDLNVIWYLLKRKNPQIQKIRNKNQVPTIEVVGEKSQQLGIHRERGFNRMLEEISTRLKIPKLECVGFVFDANGDPEDHWKKIRERIIKQHKELQIMPSSELEKIFPETPVLGGIWVGNCNPKVGMWMMPNNKDSGAIEDFLTCMIRPKDRSWGHARGYVKTIFQEKCGVMEKSKIPKADFYAWLAVQKKPGKFPGAAIKHRYLDPDVPKAQPFQKWLGNLP